MLRALRHASIVAAVAVYAAPPRALAEPACDAALAALTDLFSGTHGPTALDGMGNLQRVRIVLNQAGPCLARSYVGSPAENRCGWIGVNAGRRITVVRPPGKQTLLALENSPVQDATRACPTLRHDTQTVLGWRAPSRKGVRLRPDGLYDYTTVGITFPVVSAAQGEAIAWAESQSGPLAGGGGFVLLRVDRKGRWRVAARFPALVS